MTLAGGQDVTDANGREARLQTRSAGAPSTRVTAVGPRVAAAARRDAELAVNHALRTSRERWLAVAILAGGFVVAVAVSPSRRGLGAFLSELGGYWGPQAAAIAVLLVFRPRGAVVSGAALAMTLHFLAFDAWVHAQGEALAWLYYLFSFPGALAGAGTAALLWRRRPGWPAARGGAVAAVLTATGIALNHLATVVTSGFGL